MPSRLNRGWPFCLTAGQLPIGLFDCCVLAFLA
jgi:hypothetical protein